LNGVRGDTLPGNDSALAIVDVRGRLRLLYIESDASEARYLMQAMEKEGIELDLRQPGNLAITFDQLSGLRRRHSLRCARASARRSAHERAA
jgi:Ca-activated chloride channel family protein